MSGCSQSVLSYTTSPSRFPPLILMTNFSASLWVWDVNMSTVVGFLNVNDLVATVFCPGGNVKPSLARFSEFTTWVTRLLGTVYRFT